MYCDFDDAFVTATDLLKSQKNCVYDNILDDDSILEKSRPATMFSTQGEIQSYNQLEELYNSKQNSDSQYLNKSGTEINFSEDASSDGDGIPKFTINNKPNDKLTEKVVPAQQFYDGKNIKELINQSIENILKSNSGQTRTKRQKSKSTLSSNTKEFIFIIVIGILVLLLLDVLIRIGRNI